MAISLMALDAVDTFIIGTTIKNVDDAIVNHFLFRRRNFARGSICRSSFPNTFAQQQAEGNRHRAGTK
jgi:hypothetical protein